MRRSSSLVFLSVALWFALHAGSARGDELTIPQGSVWKYLDDGSDQANQSPQWTDWDFDDSSWDFGPGELGYGDGDEATEVEYGMDPNNKFITTYFRHSFQVNDPSKVRSLSLRIRRDDGVVVHCNGVEVYRNNLPSGPVDYLTLAIGDLGGEEEQRFRGAGVDPALLRQGSNVLAVEIHQHSATSEDISFEMEAHTIFVDDPPIVVRGPYLQRVASTEITVRWITDIATDTVLEYGRVLGQLDEVVFDPALVEEHEVVVTGLRERTVFQYAIGDSANGRFEGDDGEHFFKTSAEPGDNRAFRAWVIGDSGTGNGNAAAVREAFLHHTPVRATDLWLMLGDNAYPRGNEDDYQEGVFLMYPSLLRKVPLFATLGNHDGLSADSDTQKGIYYEVFTLPSQGECGGLASGTEAYYAFDYNNVHFVCLDSFDSPRMLGDPMLDWLEADLASTNQDWIIAFWHHPPYSKGTHDSDDRDDSDGALVDMREQVLPILEDAGVDLVLCGHSHSYERSFLIDGHCGDSSTFGPQHIVDGGDGRPLGDGLYQKHSQTPAPHEGAVYVVAGNAGLTGDGSLDHPAMFYSAQDLGSVILDFEGNRLDVTFLRETGAVDDSFSLLKGPDDPGADPRAFCATFADGTIESLSQRSGAVTVRNEGLELDSSARVAFPPADRQEPQFVMGVAAGMPVRSSVGLELPVLESPNAAGERGRTTLTLEVVHRGAGDVFARLRRNTEVIARGDVVHAGADAQPFTFRGGIRGGRVHLWIGDQLSLDAVLPASPFADSLVLVGHLPNPGTVRLEWITVRELGLAPEVHYDSQGRLWIEMYGHFLDQNFDPSQFLFRVDEEVWNWNRFQAEVLPLFDRYEVAVPGHLLIGLSAQLSSGTRVALSYGPGEDADVQRVH